MCSEHPPQRLVGPCRPWCEKIKAKCGPTLVNYGLTWPKVLECSSFPIENNNDHVCIEVPDQFTIDLSLGPSSLNSLKTNPHFIQKIKDVASDINSVESPDRLKDKLKPFEELLTKNEDNVPRQKFNSECSKFRESHKYTHIKKKGCIPKCEADILFTKEDKSITNSVIRTLAALCFVLSLATSILIFVFNTNGDMLSPNSATTFAGQTPAFLALAFVGYSFGYLISQIGIYNNKDWLCVDNDDHSKLMALEGHRSQPCVVIFLFTYFFGSAASAWWTVVAFSWAFAQYFNTKDISKLSVYCHTYGWGIPAILTLVSILNHNIQADELSSICLPGALQDDASLLYFIIIPEGVQLILSAFMFISGSVMAFCCGDARTSEKARGKLEAEALKRLKWPFFLYGILFLIAKVNFLEQFLNLEI